MSAEDDLSEAERAGLALIRERNGVYQSDFWKELDVDSRKGSRIIDKLEDRGLVEREETVYDGHNTYLVKPLVNAADLEFSLLMAGDHLSPFVGDEEIDPTSDQFSQWIMNLAYGN